MKQLDDNQVWENRPVFELLAYWSRNIRWIGGELPREFYILGINGYDTMDRSDIMTW